MNFCTTWCIFLLGGSGQDLGPWRPVSGERWVQFWASWLHQRRGSVRCPRDLQDLPMRHRFRSASVHKSGLRDMNSENWLCRASANGRLGRTPTRCEVLADWR
ncbi:hypothetical protein B0J15DRAFT_492183 [Fusarium solani]|uniref:Secreted protein n=1 Tax=Fusarium solani TaxID=169388 RepID=A0A9P9HP52_FUSSL|nr:uncharacterized protein B0J15DRAFT_492183 [Fusarium solani]KAH7260242.1 hypothetical protein B0J15DRAFT_492183 [Fusarium solani]